MSEAENKYKDIIHMQRPVDPDIYRKHPPMPLQERAKIFAPFAALRGHSDRLAQETGKLLRSSRIELSEEESDILSSKLVQVKKGMDVMVVYFEPDTPGGKAGYYVSLSGRVTEFDPVFRLIRLSTGESNEKGEIVKTIKFDDLLDVSGDKIIAVDGGFY